MVEPEPDTGAVSSVVQESIAPSERSSESCPQRRGGVVSIDQIADRWPRQPALAREEEAQAGSGEIVVDDDVGIARLPQQNCRRAAVGDRDLGFATTGVIGAVSRDDVAR